MAKVIECYFWLGYKDVSFHLAGPLLLSHLLTLIPASCHVVSWHMERPTWQGIEEGYWLTVNKKLWETGAFSPTICKELNPTNDHLSHLGSGFYPHPALKWDYSSGQHPDYILLLEPLVEDPAKLCLDSWPIENMWDSFKQNIWGDLLHNNN